MKENQKLYKIAKAIYSKLLKILYNPTTKGTKNIPEKGPIIIVGNHKHAFDPIMVMSNTNRTIHYMAKESLFKGIYGKILESIGTIKIHRNKSNPIAIKEAEEIKKEYKASLTRRSSWNLSRRNKKQNQSRTIKIQTWSSRNSKKNKHTNNSICHKRRLQAIQKRPIN